ncbi:MAG: hypothetical protein IJ109_04850 [Firmicutes bacterium]|nr:hypothetical protein [Bacillota bacterium]
MKKDPKPESPVNVEQYVMAYLIEQDRIRAMLPEGFASLRPVLRINAEIRDEKEVYIEFNTPVEADGRRGWLNIHRWNSSSGDDLQFDPAKTAFTAPFLNISFRGTGIAGGCPAEKDNEGCFFPGEDIAFKPAEVIRADREFCDCRFRWLFHEDDACGVSTGDMLPAYPEPPAREYESLPLTAANAAAIPCRKILGAYRVRFQRHSL